ncbi:MAG TPA: GNAT family protein [Gaiellales bacterium]|nr:GNAT family protein [Gaiellales bacterium]
MRAPDPPLADGAVALRPWTPDDADEIVRCCNDELVARFIPAIPVPYTEADALAYIERNEAPEELNLAITDAESRAVLGAVGLNVQDDAAVVEIGYWLAPEARGRGAATRALRLLAAWTLRELPVERLQLTTDVENAASQRVAARGGFHREGVLRAWYDRRGERRDAVMFSLLPGEQPEPA